MKSFEELEKEFKEKKITISMAEAGDVVAKALSEMKPLFKDNPFEFLTYTLFGTHIISEMFKMKEEKEEKEEE